jgi:hypothetical protein
VLKPLGYFFVGIAGRETDWIAETYRRLTVLPRPLETLIHDLVDSGYFGRYNLHIQFLDEKPDAGFENDGFPDRGIYRVSA